jgi:predicted DNA-binding protein (MmcQ/YjbR family)
LNLAPYGGAKFKWVQVCDFDCLSDGEWQGYLQKAYAIVRAKLPKKVQAELERLA